MILRKLVSILVICLMMIVSGSSVFAEEQYTEGDLYYTIEDGGIVITGYFGKEKRVVIPDQIAGIPVYKIASGAFTGTTVEELVLPDTIMTITESSISPDIKVESFASSEESEQVQQGSTDSSEKNNSSESEKSAENVISEQKTEESYIEEQVEIEDVDTSSEISHDSVSEDINTEKSSDSKGFSGIWIGIGVIVVTTAILLVIKNRKNNGRKEL